MKKSKFFLSCLAGLLGLTTLVLTGCSGCSDGSTSGGGGGTGGGGNGGGGNGGGGGDITEPVKEYKTFADYFDGARISNQVNVLVDENNAEKSFSDLLDRQIDILAQDVLFRLQVVYGTINYDLTREENKTLTFDSYVYNLNSQNAIVDMDSLLIKETEHTKGVHTTANIDCIYCYQEVVNNPNVAANFLNHTNVIKLTGAISGQHFSLDGTGALSDTEINGKQWQFNDEEKFATDYVKEVKMAIAQMLAGETNTYYSFEQTAYNNLLNKVSDLGYPTSFAANLENYIYNNVIGSERFNESLVAYNGIKEAGQEGNLKNWYKENEIERHYFKGYNIVVPAIVNMALSNTFEGTNTSLYPTVSSQANTKVSLSELSTFGKYSTVVLMPSKALDATKIKLTIKSDAATAGQSVNIKAEIRGRNTQAMGLRNVGTVTLGAAEQTVELIFNNSAVERYNGSHENFGATKLFESSAIPSESSMYGGNYIKLIFETDATFAISFTGIWQ